jgi:hypothetical protein
MSRQAPRKLPFRKSVSLTPCCHLLIPGPRSGEGDNANVTGNLIGVLRTSDEG